MTCARWEKEPRAREADSSTRASTFEIAPEHSESRPPTFETALQHSKSHLNTPNRAPNIRNRPSTFKIARQHSKSRHHTRNRASTFEITSQHPKIYRKTKRALNFMFVFVFFNRIREELHVRYHNRRENTFLLDLDPMRNRSRKSITYRAAPRKRPFIFVNG